VDGQGQMPGAKDGDLESDPGRRKPWFLGQTAPTARIRHAHASRPGHKKPQETPLGTGADADPGGLEAAPVDGQGQMPGAKDGELESDPGRRKPWFLGQTAPNARIRRGYPDIGS